jgi:hypothetical protein
MGHNKEILIKRPLDTGQEAKLPKAKVSKNNFSDTLNDVTAISDNASFNKANKLASYKSSRVLQQSAPSEIDKEQSRLDHNMLYGKTLLNSERTVTLKDNLKDELDINKTIPQYINHIKEWLEGCLSYRFVGERIGRQISKDDQMLADPVWPIISSVEAVMNLIEDNIPLGCLDTTTLNELSKDEIVESLVGDICNNLDVSNDKREKIADDCYKYYSNIEFVEIL